MPTSFTYAAMSELQHHATKPQNSISQSDTFPTYIFFNRFTYFFWVTQMEESQQAAEKACRFLEVLWQKSTLPVK